MTTSSSQHVTSKGALVHEMSLCVAPGESRCGTNFRALSRCSKYVMFSITFGAHVLQTTVCVTFGARRRSVPSRLLGGALATWAAKAGQEFRDAPAPSGFTPPRSPRSVPDNLTGPHHEHIQTSKLVSSVAGCAMHMKWLDGIGRVAGIGRTRNRKEPTIFRHCPC